MIRQSNDSRWSLRSNGKNIRYQNQWLLLQNNPVPDNVEQVKKLDDFAISILKDRRGSARNELINEDKVMERLQVKIRDIMEPFVHFGTLMRKPRTPMNCR